MPNLKNTKTEANLMAAFAGESQARNKYTYFAAAARKDGYEQIGEIFEMTANNEKEHAEIWWKLLSGGASTTVNNLTEAAAGEHYEWEEMYANFAKTAKEEGFNDIAALFALVAKIEKGHEQRFLKLKANIESGEVFRRNEPVKWQCRNCGHVHFGDKAPEICPVCKHKQAYFEIEENNY